jgi:hypothetical protein
MLMHPEYREEWDRIIDERMRKQKEQHPERLAIHNKLHRKYFYEYGIKFTPPGYW